MELSSNQVYVTILYIDSNSNGINTTAVWLELGRNISIIPRTEMVNLILWTIISDFILWRS